MPTLRSNARDQKRELDKFWRWFRAESLKLYRRWGNVNAERVTTGATKGEWIIKASCYQAEQAFRGLMLAAAPRVGCVGVEDNQKIQFMLDHFFGDHIIRRAPKQRRDDERFAIVTRGDGTREAYRGRQRVG